MRIDCAIDAPEAVTADVAIVGSGAAGQAAARRLLALGHSVVLLESGGFDHDEASADLNRGSIVGQEYHPLEHSRLRFFGGTTAIWGGRVAEFDDIDFERRDWVAGSGWPIGPDDIRELRKTLEEMRVLAEHGEGFPDADRRLHQVLFRCLGNRTLMRLVDVFWVAFYEASNFADLSNPDPMQTWREHVAIVDAVDARDTAEARNRLDRHYEGILRVIAFNKSDTLNGRKS